MKNGNLSRGLFARVVRGERLAGDDRSEVRLTWWISFGLLAVLGTLWALATPIYGAPDEPSHVLRAASVARGEVIGDERQSDPPECHQPDVDCDYWKGHYHYVRVPAGLVTPGREVPLRDPRFHTPCYAFRPDVPANCLRPLPDEGGLRTAPTNVGVDPPAFYAFAGIPSLVVPSFPGLTIYLTRILGVLASSALLASALVSLRSVRPGWVAASGFGLALTPMALFVIGSVNPNGLEIAAGIAAWASTALLAREAEARIDSRLVTRAGLAMIVLVLMRGLSVLWLAIIVATGIALCSRAGLRRLVESRAVRRWSLAVAIATIAALAWSVWFRPLDHLGRHGPDPGSVSTVTIVKDSLGTSWSQYREMIGNFGWLDTPTPTLTYLLWTIGLGLLVLLCIAIGSRRTAALVAALVVLTIAIPVAIDTSQARDIGIGWQGRWTLPFAAGVPILAALSIAWSGRRALFERSRLPGVFAVMFVVAQFLAFFQHLRRNTVGAGGSLTFWAGADWSPPVPSWLLLVGALAVLVALAAWIWRPDARAPLPSASVTPP
ncbi:MAG TPA: DUF2142 domain-containing protein [Acidimicrobiia bacterium]|nr:DUF2142 domain-containing protein [Acidimicrobiia bacterium]